MKIRIAVPAFAAAIVACVVCVSATEVAAQARQDPSLGERFVEDSCELGAEVAYAVEHEQALSLRDVLARRLQLGLRSRHRVDEIVVRRVAAVMAPRLGWEAEKVEREVRLYLDSAKAQWHEGT